MLAKFAWGPLLQAIEEREKSVRDEVEGATKANAEAQALLAQHKEMLREAGREREEMVARAKQDAEAFKNDLMAKARTEAEQIVERAKEQIEREKEPGHPGAARPGGRPRDRGRGQDREVVADPRGPEEAGERLHRVVARSPVDGRWPRPRSPRS